MGWAELIGISLRFFLYELPKFLEQYKLYKKDKRYEDKERLYLEAKNSYLRSKSHGDDMGKLRELRTLGIRH